MFVGIVDFEFLKVRIAVEELFMVRNAVVFDPIIGTDKPIGKTMQVRFPIAD